MAYQGNLEGLCGPYAIVNAFDCCGLNEDWLGRDLFKIARLAIEGWPRVLWKEACVQRVRKPPGQHVAAGNSCSSRNRSKIRRAVWRCLHGTSGSASDPKIAAMMPVNPSSFGRRTGLVRR